MLSYEQFFPDKMRAMIIISLVLSAVLGVSGQSAPKIVVRGAGAGKIAVARGKARTLIDLGGETAGCVDVSGSLRRELDRRGCTAPPADYKLLDAQAKNNRIYLVVLSEAMGNCNVCGQCGATEAFALVWVELDARLRVLDKKSVPVEYCLDGTSLVSPEITEEEYTSDAELKLPFVGDLLRVEFEKSDIEKDERSYLLTTLEYNRKTPENGFVIKTERRGKSALDER
jgi:hypothetical protein